MVRYFFQFISFCVTWSLLSVVWIVLTFLTNSSYTIFLTTSFFTVSLSLLNTLRTNDEYSRQAGVWKVQRTNIFVWLWYLFFWEFWYVMPIKLDILENTHYIETSYLISTCVYVNLSKYQFLRCYKKFLHFSRAEKEKNIFLVWNWVDILHKWDITLFKNCFLLLIADCHLFFLMTHDTTWNTGQHKELVGQHNVVIVLTNQIWIVGISHWDRRRLFLSVPNQSIDDNFTEINQISNFFIWRKLSVEVECICQKYF